MTATISSIVKAAEAEWSFWGKSTWDVPTGKKVVRHRDDEEVFAQYVLDTYCAVGGGSPSIDDIQDDRYYWSAVGMSTIMKNAGFAKKEFPFAQNHSKFIIQFIAARKNNEKAAFWGYRLGEAGGQPEVGDIVAYARGNGMTAKKAAKYFGRTTPYESHSDVVVAKRVGEIDVIGANVLDSVTKKTLSIDSAGHIQDTHHCWFATLKFR